jgi:hypothetical protein
VAKSHCTKFSIYSQSQGLFDLNIANKPQFGLILRAYV